MTTEELLSKAKLLTVLRTGQKLEPEYVEFMKTHPHYIIRTHEQYNDWICNEHHLTTNFLFKTLLPNLADFMGFEIDWAKYKWVKNITPEGHDISYYEPIDPGHYNIWCFTIDKGVYGEYAILRYSPYVDRYVIQGDFTEEFESVAGITDYHKLVAFPHMTFKITNEWEHNGKKLCISGDSQMIPLIPFLATIYNEVWFMDSRRDNVSLKKNWENVVFDDVLIAAPIIPIIRLENWIYPFEKFTMYNLK